MDYNLLENLQYCKEIVDGFTSFLLYTHIPPVAIALLLGAYVLFKSFKESSARYLFALCVIFALWTTGDLLLWLMYDHSTTLMFVWSLLNMLAGLMFVLTFFFTFSFITRQPVPAWMTYGWLVLLLPVILGAATTFNIEAFDTVDCIATEGDWYLYYSYGLGFLVALTLPFIPLFKKKEATLTGRAPMGVTALTIIGAELFILTFLITGFVATYLVALGWVSDFGIEQYGILAMAIFMGFLGYLMVQYHAFDIKVLGARILMIALLILILAEYLFIENETAFWLVTLTAVIAAVFGLMLVHSVKKEVQQREELQKLTKTLAAANDRLKELDQMKSEFLSIASHQLRAPITAVRGYASNINEGEYGPVPDHLKEPLQTVQESARLMAQSIEDYLNISRIEQNRMKYEKSDFDLADLIKKVVRELGPVATKRKLTLEEKTTEPLTVNADVGKIKQVLTNLVDNAIKYTEKGGVTLTLEHADKKARVIIHDTGIGIAPEEISGLFEKFKRARGADKVNTTGTGLGLYVAKQLVEGHGGSIKIESDGVGKGSRFIVELPALS